MDQTNKPLTDDLFTTLKEKAFKRRPQLKKILETYGDMTLLEFAKQYNLQSKTTFPKERKTQFIEAFTEETERLLGKNIAASCKKQLEITYRVTTTDHHGPLSEPGMVNSNMHESLLYLNGDKIMKNVIVLGCANVSFDNESFPRGLLFHSFKENQLITNQLVFFPRSVRACPVVYFPAYTQTHLENTKKRIETWIREKKITEKQKQTIEDILAKIYAEPSVLACKYFSEQITKTNYHLWRKIMQTYPKAPNLIYIEQEGLVTRLLKQYHLDQNTFINRLLFTPKYHELLLKHFDGILRGFSTKDKVGTYLFWAIPHGQKYRVQLWKKRNTLQTEDGTYCIPLTPDGIRHAIEKKELIPSTLLSFILLTFYYGVHLFGGSNQTTYLTQMKEAFIRMQKEYGDTESVSLVNDVNTTSLSIAIQSLAFLQTTQSSRVPATGIDFILYGNKDTITIMENVAKKLTVRDTFYRILPDCYRWYYKEEEREPELLEITRDQIEEYLHIEHKIVPAATII